jgi:hypothetical protein|eukprot:COSAG01_NODE_6772_length_3505_cov_20.000294_1_plen_518_part_00
MAVTRWGAPQALLLALSLLGGAGASVITLDGAPFEDEGYWTTAEPVFSLADTPDGDTPPTVHMDVHFDRPASKRGRAGVLEVLVFHSDQLEGVGLHLNPDQAAKDEEEEVVEEVILCCVEDMVAGESCGQASSGEVVRSMDFMDCVRRGDCAYDRVTVEANETSTKYNPDKWPVRASGVYTILVSSCDTELGITSVDGIVWFSNPYGYLPAHLYGYLPFWTWMLVAYVAVGFVWLLLCMRNIHDLLHLQMCISAILVVGMVEALSWNVNFRTYNTYGEVVLAAAVFSSVMSTGKRAVSRMLVLVVSMGFGVVKPTLGDKAKRVIILGAVYFVFGTLLEVVDWVGHSEELPMTIRLIFVMPVAALDSLFSVWIFTELSATIEQLEQRKQRSKLQLYNRFTFIMATCVFLSLVWSSYEVWVTEGSGNSFGDRWRNYWMLEAGWPALYFLVLLSIMWLWAPSKNAVRYAYSEEISLDDDYVEGSDDEKDDDGATSFEMQKPMEEDTDDDGGNNDPPSKMS